MKTLKGGTVGREPILSFAAGSDWEEDSTLNGGEDSEEKERREQVLNDSKEKPRWGRQVEASEESEDAVADGNMCILESSKHKDSVRRKPSGPGSERSPGRFARGARRLRLVKVAQKIPPNPPNEDPEPPLHGEGEGLEGRFSRGRAPRRKHAAAETAGRRAIWIRWVMAIEGASGGQDSEEGGGAPAEMTA